MSIVEVKGPSDTHEKYVVNSKEIEVVEMEGTLIIVWGVCRWIWKLIFWPTVVVIWVVWWVFALKLYWMVDLQSFTDAAYEENNYRNVVQLLWYCNWLVR